MTFQLYIQLTLSFINSILDFHVEAFMTRIIVGLRSYINMYDWILLNDVVRYHQGGALATCIHNQLERLLFQLPNTLYQMPVE